MKKVLGILLIIACLIAILPLGNIVLGYVTTSTVAETTTPVAVRLSSQHGAFYTAGRYWIFYLDASQDLSYKTSTDGTSWSGAAKIADVPYNAGALFDVVFDGTYLHYSVNLDRTGSDYFGIGYRRGVPQGDGSISWSAVEQTVLADTVIVNDMQLAVDSEGYVWIGYGGVVSSLGYPTVIKSSTNDGTWSTASGFPYTFFETLNWYVIPVPQTSGKIYCIVYRTATGEEVIKGYQWDGDSWESQQTATTSSLSNGAGDGFYGMLSAVAIDDDIHLVFMANDEEITYACRSSGSWGAESTIEDTTLAARSSPVLTKTSGGNLVCCWLSDDEKSYYKKYSDGSWDASATELTDESVDKFLNEMCLQSYYEETGGGIVLVYQTGISSTPDIVHVILTLPPFVDTDACSDETSSSFTANGEVTEDYGETITRRGFYYTTVFDDFEWGSDTDPLDDSGGAITWTISVAGTSKAEIDDATAKTGSHSARLYRNGTNSPVARFSQIASDDIEIEFGLRYDGTSGAWGLSHSNGTYRLILRVLSGTLRFTTDGSAYTDTGKAISANTWYTVVLSNFRWSEQKFDIWVDGLLVWADAVMYSNAAYTNQIAFHDWTGTSSMWVDDVYVWDVEDESGSFGEGEYDLEITGLDAATTYQVMAFAESSVGIGYGDIVEGLTCPEAPTNVAATDGDHNDKVVVTWTKSTGATGYKIYRDGDLIDTVGDVATYDDTDADAPTITPGSTIASDGASTAHVALSLDGASVDNGTTHTYKVRAYNDSGDSADSDTDTGYRGHGALTYQWQRSAADSDADYSNIDGATSSTHNDTGAPAPTITPGNSIAADGDSTAHVSLSLSGASTTEGAGRYYQCILNAEGATQRISSSNRGYRTVGELSYQWQRSSGDADEDYSNIDGAISSTHDDTEAPSPTVTPGNATASDGTSAEHVTLALSGHTGNNGAGRYYQCVLDAGGAAQQVSASNRGFRGTDALAYQWQRSAADSDADYSNMDGATTNPYNDTGAPENGDGRYYKCVVSMADAGSQESSVNRGYRAIIVPPTVTASNATSITGMSAVLHGEITDTGFDNPSIIGFEWGYASGNYSANWTDAGDFGAGTFQHPIDGLSAPTHIFWQAFAINSAGRGNSTELDFWTTSECYPPTNFTITQIGYNAYNISWTMGIAAVTTVVRASETGYPESVTDGYPIYSGNETWVIVNGVNPDMSTYYYAAWSHNDYGYSLNSAQATVGNPLGIAQLVFAAGLCGFALWQRSWIRALLSVCIIMWGAFAMPYDIKIAAPLVAVGTILFIMAIPSIMKGEERWQY